MSSTSNHQTAVSSIALPAGKEDQPSCCPDIAGTLHQEILRLRSENVKLTAAVTRHQQTIGQYDEHLRGLSRCLRMHSLYAGRFDAPISCVSCPLFLLVEDKFHDYTPKDIIRVKVFYGTPVGLTPNEYIKLRTRHFTGMVVSKVHRIVVRYKLIKMRWRQCVRADHHCNIFPGNIEGFDFITINNIDGDWIRIRRDRVAYLWSQLTLKK